MRNLASNKGLFSVVLLCLHCGARLLDDIPRGGSDGGADPTGATGVTTTSTSGGPGGAMVGSSSAATTTASTGTGLAGYGPTSTAVSTTGGFAGSGFAGSSGPGGYGGYGGTGIAGAGGSGFGGHGGKAGAGFGGTGSAGRAGAAGAAGGYLGGARPDDTVVCDSAPQNDDAHIYCKKLVRDNQWSCDCRHNGVSSYCNTRADFPCGSTNCCGLDTRGAIGCATSIPTIQPLPGCGSQLPRRPICPHATQVNIPSFGPFTACCPATAPFSCPNGTPNSCFATADLARRSCGDYCVQCQ